MPELPPAAGNLQPLPIDPAERCLNAVDAYLRHDGLGPTFGDMSFAAREEWRAVAETKPVMDSNTEYHCGWAFAELGVAALTIGEPDNTQDAVLSAFRHSLATFNRIALNPAVNRFERARALVAAGSVPLYFDVIASRGNLPSTLGDVCSKTQEALRDMVAWYGKTNDPTVRKHINSLTVMSLLNLGHLAGVQNDVVVTPSPSRYQEGVSDQNEEPSDSYIWLWSDDGHLPARIGQRGPSNYVVFDPLLLGNGELSHRGGHTMGSAQAVIDTYVYSQKPQRDPNRLGRNRFIGDRTRALVDEVSASIRDEVHVFHGVLPDPEQATPKDWYRAHPPGMEVADRRTLKNQVNTLASQMRGLSPADIEMLGWMNVEMRGDANRYTIARQALERVIGPYQERGELVKSYTVAIAAISAPVYGAINRQSPDLQEHVTEYKAQLADLATSMLDWRGQPSLPSSQVIGLDKLLQEVTVKLLLLSDQTNYLPLTASPRNRGEYMSDDRRQRHWDMSVFVANVQGDFSPAYAARFRTGEKPNDASLDECVYTVAPTMLRSGPGKHPLLRLLLRDLNGETLPEGEKALLNRTRASLELGTRVANLV